MKKNARFSREIAEHNYTSFGNKEMSQGRIRLLYLITEYDVGGAEKAMVRIISKLNRGKYDITVVALRKGSGNLMPELEQLGIRMETLEAKGKLDVLRIGFQLYRLIRNLQTGVLICPLFHPTIVGRFVGKLARTPVIVNWELNENFGGPLRILLSKVTTSLSDRIFCDSEKVKMELKRLIRPTSDMVEVLYTGGLDLDQYGLREAGKQETIKIGSVGRLVEQKGYPYLVEVARLVSERVSNVEFYIVGDGEEFNHLQNLIKKLDLSEKVKLLGFRSDIPSILSQWDIYVQPSLWEGLCITVVEAIASGLPVVATNVGGIPESVVDGHNGFLVPPRNPELLADRILKLIENPELRAVMGKRSRGIAEEKCSLDKMVKDIEAAIDALVEKKIGLVWDLAKKEYWHKSGIL